MSPSELEFLDENGYLHVPALVGGDTLAELSAAHNAMRAKHEQPWNQLLLLQQEVFIRLIRFAPILERQRAIFGDQLQLLQYDVLYQGPHYTGPARAWHRDLYFPGDTPVSVNTIIYLDDIGADGAPTYAVPGSHRGTALPPAGEARHQPLPAEVALRPAAGDVLFINSAIWHSWGINHSDRQRRTIYMYYGYWWLKRYEHDSPLPPQATANADDEQLQLLGVKPAPGGQLHMYIPKGAFDSPPAQDSDG